MATKTEKQTAPLPVEPLGDALKSTVKPKAASVEKDLLALRGLLDLTNNPAVTGAQAPVSRDRLMREVADEAGIVVHHTPLAQCPPGMACSLPVTADEGKIRTPMPSLPGQTQPQPSGAPAAIVPPVTAPSPVTNSLTEFYQRIVLTGRPGARPEEVASQAGIKCVSFDLCYQAALLDAFGIVKFDNLGPVLAEIKAVGEGKVSAEYPLSLTRLGLLRFFRSIPGGNYAEFGTPGFWVKDLLRRLQELTKNGEQLIVIGVKSIVDFNALKAAGFTPFHVVCSNQTAAKTPALVAGDDGLCQHLDNYVTSIVSRQPNGERIRAIWNDQELAPSPRLYTPATFFSNIIKKVEQSVESPVVI